MPFQLVSDFKPKGDQPQAIKALVDQCQKGAPRQTLLGVTGSGKTFTMACVIEALQRPALVISHNKTLAAQLYSEFKDFFPKNAVEYFVSYYDYYQPEAYIPQTDTYIAKDASINQELDRLRLSATHSLLTRRDTVVVASVSCIYGIGSPTTWQNMLVFLKEGEEYPRDRFFKSLVDMQYSRNDIDFFRGNFRVRGDTVEIYPSYGDTAFRLEFFGDKLEKLTEIDTLTATKIRGHRSLAVYPAKHYVMPQDEMKKSLQNIEDELQERLAELKKDNKLVEFQRLEQRTHFDLEMMQEIGYCSGIENYSRHLDGRKPGEPPYTLLDYLPQDALIFIDESHVTLPQLHGMYKGDRSRKDSLVEYGFRLRSAYDNRPLYFEEFEQRAKQVVFVSATPAEYELKQSKKLVAEQIIRPTGLSDPQVILKKSTGQIDDVMAEIRRRAGDKERTLVTTLTKRMAEDLTEYLKGVGIKVQYLHSDVETLERVKIIRELRLGTYDVLVGINLLREGLDIPEVSLVAILDADKEGFLRSERSLIQTMGRAARHIKGTVILYADKLTDSIKKAIAETSRRRDIQLEYNKKNHITPESVKKAIREDISTVYEADYYTVPLTGGVVAAEDKAAYIPPDELPKIIVGLEQKMREAARRLEFEKAALIRDRIKSLREHMQGIAPSEKEVLELLGLSAKKGREIVQQNKKLKSKRAKLKIRKTDVK